MLSVELFILELCLELQHIAVDHVIPKHRTEEITEVETYFVEEEINNCQVSHQPIPIFHV